MWTRPKRQRFTGNVFSLWLCGALLCSLPVLAQDPVVTAADPDMAEQETYDLEVTVSGDNFSSNPEVDFLVTGTEDSGGIQVKSVKRRGPKSLKVTIDIAPDAQTQYKFDIRVRNSNGRTGKGIELFRVQEKTHPTQDTTPPGDVTNLVVVSGSETYWNVTLQWTVPADDGYDPNSGPVESCLVEAAEAGEPWQSLACLPTGQAVDWGLPGEIKTCEVTPKGAWDFRQNTQHSFSVRCRDEAYPEQWSNRVETSAWTLPFSDYRDPSWVSQEIPIALEGLLGHAFDADRDPLIVGSYGGGLRIIQGSWTGVAWQWGSEDIGGYADAFAMDPSGRPAFAGMKIASRKIDQLLYTFWDASQGQWSTELVDNFQDDTSAASIAIDPRTGLPMVGYCAWDKRSGGGLYLARRTAQGDWQTELIDARRCVHEVNRFEERKYLDALSIAFDSTGSPAILYGRLIDNDDLRADAFELAVWSDQDGTWQVEDVPSSSDAGFFALGYSASPGGYFATFSTGGPKMEEVCLRQDSDSWDCNDFNLDLWEGPRTDSFGEIYQGTQGGNGQAQSVIVAQLDLVGGGATLEYVDYYQEYVWPQGEPKSPNGQQIGPLVAVSPSVSQSGQPLIPDSPTLSWMWNTGPDASSDYHLYFAYKETP